MENKRLSEVISLLLSRSYTIDFNQLSIDEEQIDDYPSDFLVDEMYCCRERFQSGRNIFVFAISSESLNFKGILISGNVTESVDFWNALTQTLENLKASLSHLLTDGEYSKARQ